MKKSTKVLIAVELIIILGLTIRIFVSKSDTNNITNDNREEISTDTEIVSEVIR